MEILEVTQEHIKVLGDRTIKESIGVTTEMKVTTEIEVGTGLGKGHFLEVLITKEMIGV